MKAIVFFQVVFYSLINIMDTYQGNLLIEINIKEEYFSMIFAALSLIRGISLMLKEPIERKFKNRTLSFISLTYISACIIVGGFATFSSGKFIIPIIILMYAIQKATSSIWYILEYKYVKNFTNEHTRSKITFAYEVIGGISASIISIISGLLLNIANIRIAFLLVGLFSLAAITVVLDYMRTRFGLKPEEYKKEEIELEI